MDMVKSIEKDNMKKETMEKDMKGRYAQIIEKKFKEKGYHFNSHAYKDETIFELPMEADNAPGLNVRLIIDENGDSKFRCYLASNVPVVKRQTVAMELNHLNLRYRYICLSIDDDGDVCASYDFVVFGDEKNVCDQVLVMMFLYADIVDKCIPSIMQTIWKENEKKDAIAEKIKVDLFDTEGGDEE